MTRPSPACPNHPSARRRHATCDPARRRFAAACLASALVLGAALVAPAPAEAQGGFGVRAGVSADPDQFFVGLHYETEPMFDRLRFRPNAEIGFGDDLTLLALNAEFAYWLPVKARQWGVYVGGGPAMNVYIFDEEHPRRGDDDTEIEPGLNFLFGVQHRQGFFTELKIGAIDSPDFKFTVGYAWR
jgi:hypothetical protein